MEAVDSDSEPETAKGDATIATEHTGGEAVTAAA